MAFDILGRVTRSKQTTDGVEYGGGTDPTKWMTYTYNLSGALIEQQYPSGRVVENTLDTDGSLQQVQSRRANDTFRNYANAFAYTAAGAVTSMRLGNGKFESTQFNSRLQPPQIALGGSAGNTNLLKLNYDYGTTDNNGNVKSQTITVPTVGSNQGFVATQNYTYDSLNRLKSAIENITGQTPPSWKQTFTFDRYGNRRFDVANTTTIPTGCAEAVCNPQIDPATNKLIGYQFDSAGNTKVDANGQAFTYDSENKQVKVQNGSTVIGEYFYDGDGKRIKKVVPSGETTVFVYDAGGKSIAEYSTIVEPQQTAKVSYLTNDHLGSPRIATDAVGQTVSRRDFRPYGEEIARSNYGTDSVRQKFTTYERDTETNLDFAQARTFGSNLGRFTSPDPYGGSGYVAIPQSWNRYAYCLNRPLMFIDPSGLIWLTNDGGSNFIWVDDKDYKKNKSQYDGYVGANGTVIKLGNVTGFGGKYENLVGSFVLLKANGTITESEEARAESATVEVRAEYDEIDAERPWGGIPGTLRTPVEGPPNTYDKYKGGTPGKYTLRYFDDTGRAKIDIDFGHDHGAGDPHAHWWDWSKESPRGPGEPIPAGSQESVDEDGDRVIRPFVVTPAPGRVPGRAPAPARPTAPIRLPIRIPIPVPIIP